MKVKNSVKKLNINSSVKTTLGLFGGGGSTKAVFSVRNTPVKNL